MARTRPYNLVIRVTLVERALMQFLARDTGETVSGWARRLLLTETDVGPKRSVTGCLSRQPSPATKLKAIAMKRAFSSIRRICPTPCRQRWG